MKKWPEPTAVYDPEVSGKIEDRTERKGVLGPHGFAMVLGAFGGAAVFAGIGGALGGVTLAIVLALVGAGIGAFAGGAAATAMRPTRRDLVEQEHLTEIPSINDR